MTTNKLSQVREFHETYGANINDVPTLPNQTERDLRIKLLQEEFTEYLEGERNNDMVEIADALGDMLYIIYGTCVSYGLPINEVFNEIHASNMSKLGEDGKPIYREDGKVLKGPNYFKPNIAKILNSVGVVK